MQKYESLCAGWCEWSLSVRYYWVLFYTEQARQYNSFEPLARATKRSRKFQARSCGALIPPAAGDIEYLKPMFYQTRALQ